jgi:YVTN family beta-propeller protein
MRHSLSVLAFLLLTACPSPGERAPDAVDAVELARVDNGPVGFVFTADEDGNSVTRVDLATGETARTALPISPHNLQISADGHLLMVVGSLADHVHANGNAADEQPGLLLILDPATLTERAPPIEIGPHPAHVIVDRQNRFAYVTDSDTDSLWVIDLETGTVAAEIATCAYPHGLRMSPDEREIYAACVEDDQVSVIDVTARAESDRIDVGRAPVQVGFTGDGEQVYVSLRDDDAVAIIDTRTRAAVRSISVGRGPIQVYATPDSRFVYVANEGSREQPDNRVSVIDRRSEEVISTLVTDAGAHGVVVSDDGRHAFVSNLFTNSVSVIDISSQQVTETFPVGEGPAGITYRPPGHP